MIDPDIREYMNLVRESAGAMPGAVIWAGCAGCALVTRASAGRPGARCARWMAGDAGSGGR